MKPSKLKAFILKQYDVGPWLGTSKALVSREMFYYGLFNAFIILAMGYNTTLKETLIQWVPWMTFWKFLAIVVSVFSLGGLVIHKLEIASTIRYQNKESYKHGNLIRRHLARIEKQNKAQFDKLEAELGEIKKQIGGQRIDAD